MCPSGWGCMESGTLREGMKRSEEVEVVVAVRTVTLESIKGKDIVHQRGWSCRICLSQDN